MTLKNILLTKNYTLITKLAAEEVCRRIADNTGAGKTFGSFFERSNTISKPYQGVVSSHSFEIKRVVSYQNSFLPIIKGNFYEVEGKTNVKIQMNVHKLVFIFTLMAVGLFLIGDFFFNRGLSNSETPGGFYNLVFKSLNFVLPIVFVGIMYISFFRESNISKKFLSKLLEEENSKV